MPTTAETKPPQQALPDTNIAHLLGYIQKQGGSELFAGVRALLTPSLLTEALSTFSGRIKARTALQFALNEQLTNYVLFRPYAIMEVTRRTLPENVANPTLLDPASGYTPQHILLASELPHLQFIEMDQPKTILDKLIRLQNHDIPANLRFMQADLEHMLLHEVIQDKVDLLIVDCTFVSPQEFVELLGYLRQMLREGGRIISAFPYRPGIEDLARTSAVFRRLASNPAGIVPNKSTITDIFHEAGYTGVEIYELSTLAREMQQPIPADIEVIATARI